MFEFLFIPIAGFVILNIIFWLIGGAIIGWLAGQITDSDRGFLSNAFIDIIGSAIGSLIARLFGQSTEQNWFIGLIFSVIRAVVLTFIVKQFNQRV
jgi:uncharacterized membrane protein YeaQ/YmgE (transglycosylase-associated protein family)